MKRYNMFRRLLACTAAALALLAAGCGEDPSSLPEPPVQNVVTLSDVSGSDVSGSDVSGADVSDSDLSGSDVSASDVSGGDVFGETATGPVLTVMLNAEAMNSRDLEGYMATIDPESDVLNSTREDTEYMFAHYRLAVTLDSIEIEEYKDDTAVVTVTQTTLPVIAPPVSASDVSGSDVSASDVSASDTSSSDVSGSDAAPLSGKDLTDTFVPCTTVLSHRLVCRDGSWYIASTTVQSYRELTPGE